MPASRRRPAALVTVLALAMEMARPSTAPVAYAQPGRAGERLLAEAVSSFNAGEFERSLQLLRRALPELRGAPSHLARAHLYVGLDHAFLGRFKQAKAAFATALAYDAGLELDAERIKAPVVQLFQEVRSGLQGFLRIEVDLPDASVRLESTEVGPAPVRLSVQPGWYFVRVSSADGRRVLKRRLLVGVGRETLFRAILGDTAVLLLRSRPAGALVLVDGQRTGVTPLTMRDLTPGTHEIVMRLGQRDEVRRIAVRAGERRWLDVAFEPLSGRPPRRRLWTWVAGGSGLALLALGGGIWGWGARDFARAQDTVNRDPSRFEELDGKHRSKYLAGQVLFGAGAVLAAASVVLFFVEGRRAEGRPGPSLSVRPSEAGAVLGGRF